MSIIWFWMIWRTISCWQALMSIEMIHKVKINDMDSICRCNMSWQIWHKSIEPKCYENKVGHIPKHTLWSSHSISSCLYLCDQFQPLCTVKVCHFLFVFCWLLCCVEASIMFHPIIPLMSCLSKADTLSFEKTFSSFLLYKKVFLESFLTLFSGLFVSADLIYIFGTYLSTALNTLLMLVSFNFLCF